MKEALRILVMAPDLPFPIRAGGQMRMASFVTALSKVGRVHVACVARELPGETLNWCTQLGVSITHLARPQVSPVRLWQERLEMVLSGSNLVKRSEEGAFFEQEYRQFNPDVVWLETPYLNRYALAWKGEALIVTNYWGTSEGALRDTRLATGLDKVWQWLRWRAAKGGEQTFAPQLDAIVAVSELDAGYFRGIAPRVPVYAIPNGIVKPAVPDRAGQAPLHKNEMIFTGDLSYRPNVDAVQYFTRDILPAIRQQLPAGLFRVVGRAPVPEVKALAKPDAVEIVGFVLDLAGTIATAAIYVLPMRLGSGIRSKLFDVFPLGKAIVTTSVGAEGLELHDGENCRIADTPEAFAAACLELLESPEKRLDLEAGCLRLAREVYSQDRVNARVREVLGEVRAQITTPTHS